MVKQQGNYSCVVRTLENYFEDYILSLTPKLDKKGRYEKVSLRVRMSAKDAHYGGGLVDGAHMLHLFGDIATELLIRHDGDEGLFAGYEEVRFLAPVYAGDYIEAEGEIIAVGKTSRKMQFTARKVITPRSDINESAADLLEDPTVVCTAVGTCVTPIDKQRL